MSGLKTASSRLSQLAKCLSRTPTSQLATMSSPKSTPIAESETAPEVLFTKQFNSRVVTLNRPAAYNALNLNMIERITEKLKIWENCDQTNVIVLKSDLPKAFCAGGDVKAIVQKLNAGNRDYGREFFTQEYSLNHMIATSPKPIVAFMNGITMGGGVGLSVHAPFRVATETSVLAMPETAIGFFPDVGATFFLPRMEGGMGTFLALTGSRIGAGDMARYGLATHFIPSAQLPHVVEQLGQAAGTQWESVHVILEAHAATPPPPVWAPHQPWIDRCFQHTSLNAILAALRRESDPKARETLDTLLTMSPVALHLTLMQMQEGKNLDLASAFYLEWSLARVLSMHPDFIEGVTAKLILKRPVMWPSAATDVDAEAVARALFADATAATQRPPRFLTRDISYFRSPFRVFGFPNSSSSSVQQAAANAEDVQAFREYFLTYHPDHLQRISSAAIGKVGAGVSRSGAHV